MSGIDEAKAFLAQARDPALKSTLEKFIQEQEKGKYTGTTKNIPLVDLKANRATLQ